MGDVTSPKGLPLWSDHTRFVRRHRRLIAALMVLGLLCGFGWSTRHAPTYSATASVALAAVPKYVTDNTTQLLAPTVSIDTEAQLLRSHQVMSAVADSLGTDETAAAAHLNVSAAELTRVLRVTITASSPRAAADAANAAVYTLVKVVRDTLGALQDSQLNQLRSLLDTRERQLAQEQGRHMIVPVTDDLFNEVLELQADLDELDQARQTPVKIVDPAEPPRHPDYPNTQVPVVSGLMLGLLLACAIGAARDRSAVPALNTSSLPVITVRRRTVASDPS